MGASAGATDLGTRWLSDLLRPDAFPHRADNLRLVETHISWVVLAGTYAYKIRKPVNFGFLDFSTLDRRRADCEDEVRLNWRLCPDLYLGVVDLVERKGRVYVGGDGRPLEPAVRMRRLPEWGMLPVLLAREQATDALVVRIAERLAAFHATAATGAGVDEHGSVATITHNWAENFEQTATYVGRALSATAQAEVRQYVDRFLAAEQLRLEQRVQAGRIRDGHGDLHAGSVCVAGRRLYLFDCVEFSARFRCADVAAEVAFLAMDLDHLGYANLSWAFVDAYVNASGDQELLPLLDFYKCYRAFVRGKVLSFRLDEPELPSEARQQITARAAAYFDLAQTYARPLRPPVLVVTMGLPATGKTTVARAIASRLAMVHLSSDVLRKQLAGLRPTSHRVDPFGRGLYSNGMSRRTYAALRRRAGRWLKRGQSVVLDATYGQRRDRADLRHLARRAGVRLIVIECWAPEAVLLARLAARESDPNRTSDARLQLWPALRATYTEPAELHVTRVDTTRPLEHVVDELVPLVRIAAEGPARAA